jgi:hypothetical protein
MPTDPRKRQRKLERRANKRKEKKHYHFTAPAGLVQQLTASTKYPPLDTWIGADLWSQGLGWVLFSRQLPSGSIAVVVFLVDRYCLGVKDAMAAIVSRFEYESDFVGRIRSMGEVQDVSPATARMLVEQAVAYAQSLGLHPHPDYHKVKAIFGDVDASASAETFEFGKNGKPLFISGPNDTPQRCRQIISALTRTCGEGGFHFIIGGGPDTGFIEEDLEDLDYDS